MSSGPESASFAMGYCLPHCSKRYNPSIEQRDLGQVYTVWAIIPFECVGVAIGDGNLGGDLGGGPGGTTSDCQNG